LLCRKQKYDIFLVFREEQYKVLWNELEEFFRSNMETSSNHRNVFDCFLECTGRGDTNKAGYSKKKGNEEKRFVIVQDCETLKKFDYFELLHNPYQIPHKLLV